MRTKAEAEPARVSRSWSSRYTSTNERKASERGGGGATVRKGVVGVRIIHRGSGAGWCAQTYISPTWRHVY
jgi:hypothetical protein